MTHAEPRYLEAKRSVDDRALSSRVRDRLLETLPSEPTILEAGCGTGTMVPRLVDWGVTGTYRGVDQDRTVVAFAREVRAAEFRYTGHEVVETNNEFQVGDISVSFHTGDALETFQVGSDADLFIAAGFADLVDPSDLLAAIKSALGPGGVAYLPITFDGGTIFQPDHRADEVIERAYHRAIAEIPGRDPWAGRHLADELRTRPGELVAMDASDWIVRPTPTGSSAVGSGHSADTSDPVGRASSRYPVDEAFFLGRILDFVERSIRDSSRTVDRLENWLSIRRDQLRAGELTYVAHQYDFLFQMPPD